MLVFAGNNSHLMEFGSVVEVNKLSGSFSNGIYFTGTSENSRRGYRISRDVALGRSSAKARIVIYILRLSRASKATFEDLKRAKVKRNISLPLKSFYLHNLSYELSAFLLYS